MESAGRICVNSYQHAQLAFKMFNYLFIKQRNKLNAIFSLNY